MRQTLCLFVFWPQNEENVSFFKFTYNEHHDSVFANFPPQESNNILFDYQKQTLRQQVSIGLIQFI